MRVAIEDEGLTISSPGGFIEGVNLNNLLTVEPHGRNQALADVLKRIGLAERTGRGIDRIFEGSIVYGRPLPDYSESTERYVKLFIQRAKADVPFIEMISREEKKIGRSLPINALLILSALQTQGRMSLDELAATIHISESRVKANVENLVESGLVEVVGDGNAPAYRLNRKVDEAEKPVVDSAQQRDNDTAGYEEAILALAKRQNGYVVRENVCDLLNIGKDKAYRILKRMVLTNKLSLVGRGRSAKYQLKE